MERIRIVQIGMTHEHAAAKMTTLRKMEDVFEIVGYVDDRETVQRPYYYNPIRSEYDGLRKLTMEEALADDTIQAALIEVPNDYTVKTAMPFMEKGIALHVEKPAGTDLAEYKKLLDGCKKKDLPFQMGFMFRANPGFRFVVDAVKNGWLGEIFEFTASMGHDYGNDAYHEYIHGMPGGQMYNLGCHFIDIAAEILGRPQNVYHWLKSAPGEPDTLKNNCTALLEYPHATAVIRSCSRECHGSDHRRLRICGTKGTIEMSPVECFGSVPVRVNLTLSEAVGGFSKGEQVVGCGMMTDRFIAHLQNLAGMIRGTEKDLYSREHDYLVHEIVLAASGLRAWDQTGSTAINAPCQA